MKTRLLAGLIVAAALTSAPALVATDHAVCSDLMRLKLPDVKVTEAVAVPAPATGPITVAHCRVAGVIGTEIKFSLLLPDTWNRKFLMGGGGGFVGSVVNQALEPDFVANPVVNAGYATVGTDTGHQGTALDASWAPNNLERQVHFGYLAVHRPAERAKAILPSYYGPNENPADLFGCSHRRGAGGGGRQPGFPRPRRGRRPRAARGGAA